jgi:hypothetical protein
MKGSSRGVECDARERCAGAHAERANEPVELVEDASRHRALGYDVGTGGGAQLRHGGRGIGAAPTDVADDEREPPVAERNDVEPVAAP